MGLTSVAGPLMFFLSPIEASMKVRVDGPVLADDRDYVFNATGCTASARMRDGKTWVLTVVGDPQLLKTAKSMALQCIAANNAHWRQNGRSRTWGAYLYKRGWPACVGKHGSAMCLHLAFLASEKIKTSKMHVVKVLGVKIRVGIQV